MTEFTPISGTIGGVLLGLSAIVLMGGIGRVAGISGIFGAFMSRTWTGENSWRWMFFAGLVGGTMVTALAIGVDRSSIQFPGDMLTMAVSGVLVGVGAAMGSGCTSGHGICGISRLSPRSFISTGVFMAVAVVTVFVMRHGVGG